MEPDKRLKVGDLVRTLRPYYRTYPWSGSPTGTLARVLALYGESDAYDLTLLDGSYSYLWYGDELEKLDPVLVAVLLKVHSETTKRIEELKKTSRSTG